MIKAVVLTPWIGTGVSDGVITDPYRPQIADDYLDCSFENITGQPIEELYTNPNSFSVVIIAPPATFDLIDADPKYIVLPETIEDLSPVVGSPVNLDKIPDAAEFGQFRADMAKMKGRDNKPIWKQQQINDAVGNTVNGRTWNAINIGLVDYQKDSTKQVGRR